MKIYQAFLPPASGRRVQVSVARHPGLCRAPGVLEGQRSDLMDQAAPRRVHWCVQSQTCPDRMQFKHRECEYVPTNTAKVVHAGLVVSQALREPAGVSPH